MPAFQSKQRVDHSADEMFDLVADVERYSQFVPLCLRNVIRSHETRVETEGPDDRNDGRIHLVS
jgi:coenzyme Q-binding protein COQ10